MCYIIKNADTESVVIIPILNKDSPVGDEVFKVEDVVGKEPVNVEEPIGE